MKLAFLGTPPFAVATLDALARAGHDVACVVAQPDRPAGRGQALRAPAAKAWALEHGVPVLQPEKVRDGRLAAELAALAPDLLVVVAYGRILGQDLLDLAPHGAVNVHASLLPRWRGAAPIQWAVASGDRESGVTLMRVEAGLDAGPILLQRALALDAGETAATLHDRLAALGAEVAVEGLALLATGRLTPVRQDEARVTLARPLGKEDGRLDFERPAAELEARVRGFTPWPGVFTLLGGKLLKVHAARVVEGAAEGSRGAWGAAPPALAPGEVRVEPGEGSGAAGANAPSEEAREGGPAGASRAGGLLVGCGRGSALLLTEVQLEGRRRMPAAELARGLHLAPGAVLGR